jgi:hypothetical protein
MIRNAGWCFLFAGLVSSVLGQPISPAPGGWSYVADGIQYVDGEPFIKTAGWWGINHWMSQHPDRSLGNQLALPDDFVGGDRDFYARAGFSTAFYTIVGDMDMTNANLSQLKTAIERAKKVGQKVVIHINCTIPASIVAARKWMVTDENGKEMPQPGDRFYPDPQAHAEAMRERLKPITEAIRDEPTVIGYQIGGETWTAISYDPASIGRYRAFLKGEFSLEQLGERYLGAKNGYKDWDQVVPPVKGGEKDFSGKTLANGRVAWFDWARFNKKVHEDLWVAMIEAFNESDGRGRPISYEYNHGPYSGSAYGLYNFNFEGVCARTKNFSVGPGEFAYSLAESMHGLFTKACGPGPWFTNELDARVPSYRRAQPAYFRRHIWWTLALGGNGYHFWTFFNVLGANNEFIGERCFDPIRAENLAPGFFEAQHCNRMIASLGPLLAGSRAPEMPIGIFYLEDSSMAGYAGSYKADSYSILRALAARGLGDQVGIFTEYHLERMDLGRFKAILLPRTPRITGAHQQKLSDYVAQGGTLILMAPTGKANDLCRDSEFFPSEPLAKACGIEARELPPAELRKTPVTLPWSRQMINMDIQAKLRIPAGSHARPILTLGKEIIASQNAFGKGRCFYLAGRPLVISDDDPSGTFLCSMLYQGGVAPAALLTDAGQVDTGVYAGRRLFKEGGGLLILIENQDRTHDLKVKIDPLAFGLDPRGAYTISECFGSDVQPLSAITAWTFSANVEPVGIRVYAVIPGKDLGAALPTGRKLAISRNDPDAVLIPKRAQEKQPSYFAGDALAGRRELVKLETTSAAELRSGPPWDLGDNYLGLDIDGACNRSLSSMLKNVEYSGMNQFGAGVARQDARETLPLTPGRVALGTVPVWVNGRYIEMGSRLVEGVRVGTRVSSLHFFHHGIYWLHESVLGFYRVRYADGTVLNVPIALGTTLSDLDRPWGISPRTEVIWTAKNGNRLSRFDWINPLPDRVVTSVDIVRNDGPEIVVWGITAKKAGLL